MAVTAFRSRFAWADHVPEEGCEACYSECSTTAPTPTISEDGSDRESANVGKELSGARRGSESRRAKRQERVTTCKPMDTSTCTTVIMQNVPRCYTRDMLFGLFESFGFATRVDFLFLSIDFSTGENQEYAYVNLVTALDAAEFVDTFDGFSRWWRSWCQEPCRVIWSGFEQGFKANVERYRNSPLMHPAVPDSFRPAIFSGGVRQEFPPPTNKLRKPRGASVHFASQAVA